jgi:hypothetical protein
VTQVAGPIRLTAPLSFGIGHLAPRSPTSPPLHPKVELDISSRTDGRPGRRRLRPGRADRHAGGFGADRPPHRAVAPVVVGSPAYLDARGGPSIRATSPATTILVYGNEQWRFRVGNRWEHVRLKPRLRADNGEMLRAGRRGGARPVRPPQLHRLARDRSGTLEPLLRDFPIPEAGLHIRDAAGPRRHRPGARPGRLPRRPLRPGAELGPVLDGAGEC